MRAHGAYLLVCGLAVAMASLAAGLQVPTVSASPQKSATVVNRALKGDRLPVLAPAGNANTAPSSYEKLPDGCEASVSAMTKSPLARTPARCIS